MTQRNNLPVALCSCAAAVLTLAGAPARAGEAVTQEQLRQLQQQNQVLQDQLRQQQALIESLTRKVDKLQADNTQHAQQMDEFKTELKDLPGENKPASGIGLGKVILSGEGAVGFFDTGSHGKYPNSTFRVDEARLFVEAPVYPGLFLWPIGPDDPGG
jgi:TolA-binding protein